MNYLWQHLLLFPSSPGGALFIIIVVVIVIYYSVSAPVLLRDMERLGWYSAWLQ